MKRFLLVVMLFASVASVYAAELKITGDAEVRGLMWNEKYDGDLVDKDSYFDADFNFNAALVLTENTTVFTKLTFDAEQDGTATVPDSEAADAVTMLGVERAYISTKFLPALTVDAGLLGGGTWGTAFGNTETNVTRIKGTYAVSEDIKIMAIYEKVIESNDTTLQAGWDAKEADILAALTPVVGAGLAQTIVDGTYAKLFDANTEGDFGDTTSYYLEASIKTAGITILPLLKYQTIDTEVWINNRIRQAMIDAGFGAVTDDKSTAAPSLWTADLAVMGDMGMVGFEAEFIYSKQTGDDFLADLKKYGAYVDVFAKTDMAKAGVALFYLSADATDGNMAAGSDFDFTILTENDSLTNAMGGKLYAADIKIVDKISADAAFAYVTQVDKDQYEFKFWEVDAGVKYAIDAVTSYTIEGGYKSLDNTVAKDNMYMVRQVIAVKF